MSECDRIGLRARWGLKYVGLSHFTIQYLQYLDGFDKSAVSLVYYYTFYKIK